MSQYKEKPIFQWIYAGISVAVLIFFVCVLLWGYNIYQDYVAKNKEKLKFAVELSPSIDSLGILNLQETIQTKEYYLLNSLEYVDRESIRSEFEPLLTDSLQSYLNLPFRDVLFFNANKDYFNTTQVVLIKADLLKLKGVENVYNENLNFREINDRVDKSIYAVILLFIVFLGLVILFLFNTIRMTLYSRKRLIYNQLLIGASRRLIARPIILSSFLMAITSNALGIGFFVCIFQYLVQWLQLEIDYTTYNYVLSLAFVVGANLLLIPTFAWFIVRRNLKLMEWED
jgi:cell division transport system permease protein